MAIRVFEETGLLRTSTRVMSWDELQRLKPVAPSMGMMLETTSRRLFEEPGGAHYGSPDKDPAVRLRVLEDAGRSTIPFTTGILIGIGETPAERVDSLFEIRCIARAYGAIRRSSSRTSGPSRTPRCADARRRARRHGRDHRGGATGARPADAHPGAAEPHRRRVRAATRRGHRRLGRRLAADPDHVNPERPWPQIDELAARTAAAGFELRERLTVHPRYVTPASRGSTRGWSRTSPRSPAGRAGAGRRGVWAGPGRSRTTRGSPPAAPTCTPRSTPRANRGPARGLRQFYGDWATVAHEARRTSVRSASTPTSPPRSAPPSATRGLSDADALALLHCDGVELDAVAALADGLRADTVGGDVTYVVNRNINFTNVCYTGCRFCAFAQRRTDADAYTLSMDEVARRADEAWELGATEVCMQGGIHPDLPGTAYFDIARAVKARVPEMHVHAFSPMEIVNGAARTGLWCATG